MLNCLWVLCCFQVLTLQVNFQLGLARWFYVNPATLIHTATNKAGNTDYWYSIHNPSEIKNYKHITNLLLGADNAWRETQHLGMTPHGRCNQKSQASTT
jgi:hypothetical protein